MYIGKGLWYYKIRGLALIDDDGIIYRHMRSILV